VQFGLAMFPTEYAVSPTELGRMAEQRGFESLFFPEHTHIPVSRATPYPMGGELPDEYRRTYDPFVALGAVAAVTERLRLGTGICLLVERDPIVTAKAVATLDQLSGGRVLFGVGAGWNVEEMANHGTDASTRFALLRERVEAMKRIWTEDEPSYAGKNVSFEAIWSWPKPVQRPHPPILVGGNGRQVLDRVMAYGDEWLPNAVGDEDRLRARITALRRRADADGRPMGVTVYGIAPSPPIIESYATAGATRGVFWLPSEVGVELEPRMDRYAAVMAQVRGTP